MSATMADIPAGICHRSEMKSYVKLAKEWARQAYITYTRFSINPSITYDEYDGRGLLNDIALTESETPICDDIHIDIGHIKLHVRLSDANVFRVCTTEHSVPRALWHMFWPYDFLEGGVINPERHPIGKGPVILAAGLGFYPIFGGYVALCGETAGRYMSQIAPFQLGASLPYQGFRIGQLVAMEEDLTDNNCVFDLRDLSGVAPIEFTYSHADMVGIFRDSGMTLVPITMVSNFCPYVNEQITIEWPGFELSHCTADEWNERVEKGRSSQSSTTAPDAGSADAPASASGDPRVSISSFMQSIPSPQGLSDQVMFEPIPEEVMKPKKELVMNLIESDMEDSHFAVRDAILKLRSDRQQILLLLYRLRHRPVSRTAERAAQRSMPRKVERYQADRLRLLSNVDSETDPAARYLYELTMMSAGVYGNPLNMDRLFDQIVNTGRL